MAQTLELEDIQGLFARGYGNLKAARYVLLEIRQPAPAAAWLGRLAARLTTGRDRPVEQAINVALTAGGMAKLGLPQDVLGAFSNELVSGMTTAHRRRILGDLDESAPERWAWGGPTTAGIDVLLLLFGAEREHLEALDRSLAPEIDSGGLSVLARLETSDLDGVEHFGFRDGVSQPLVEGLGRAEGADVVRAGEFVLGYRNEYGRYAARPLLSPESDPGVRASILPRDPEGSGHADLGKNGSYLVFRQLAQDVPAFWRFVDRAVQASGASGAGGDGAGGGSGGGASGGAPGGANGDTVAGRAAARVRLAAKMVGRWPSGAPLALSPERDDPALAESNDFAYHLADPHGYACPIGAHVRRANPRDSLDPDPGTDRSLAVNKRHRLLRRGREYGPPLAFDDSLTPLDPGAADAERGLYFICLNTSIGRQFEFVQSTWLNNPKFAGLYDDSDPLVAAHGRPGGTFTVQGAPVRQRVTGLPRFVTVRGGAYFFLPGIRAVRYLSLLGTR